MHPDTVLISAPSRLHFGLFPGPLGQAGLFGGAGVMLSQPRTTIRFHSARERKIHGIRVERTTAFVERWLAAESGAVRGFDLNVIEAPGEHVGLGSGTQLALAVGIGLRLFLNAESAAVKHLSSRATDAEVLDVAERQGRAGRTVIGTRGFQLGGMLVDWGRDPARPEQDNYRRMAFPGEWPILLVTLPLEPGLHGLAEQSAFEDEVQRQEGLREEMLGLLQQEILPAVEQQNFSRFAAALFPFGCASGRIFEKIQGGLFCSPEVAELAARFRRAGAEAVIQSSWGPTLGVIFESTESAAKTAADVLTDAPEGTAIQVTAADNHGSRIETDFQLPS